MLPAQAGVDHLAQKADAYRDKAMLSLTHGQPATPTTLGKELAVYVYRLNRQLNKVKAQNISVRSMARPARSVRIWPPALMLTGWPSPREFVTNRMGLTWNPLTTQIESHDWQAELYGTISHTNRILHNLCVDVWMYILPWRVRAGTGQGRDRFLHHAAQGQSDSFRERRSQSGDLLLTIGHFVGDAGRIALAARSDRLHHAAQHRLRAGLFAAGVEQSDGWSELHPSERCCHPGRARFHWEVLGEPIQTAMRACELAGLPGMDKPYEKVKELMRGHEISKDDVERFIDQQAFDEATAARLKR